MFGAWLRPAFGRPGDLHGDLIASVTMHRVPEPF